MLSLLVPVISLILFTATVISRTPADISFMLEVISSVILPRFLLSWITSLLPVSISEELEATFWVISLSMLTASSTCLLPALCSSIAFRIVSS